MPRIRISGNASTAGMWIGWAKQKLSLLLEAYPPDMSFSRRYTLKDVTVVVGRAEVDGCEYINIEGAGGEALIVFFMGDDDFAPESYEARYMTLGGAETYPNGLSVIDDGMYGIISNAGELDPYKWEYVVKRGKCPTSNTGTPAKWNAENVWRYVLNDTAEIPFFDGKGWSKTVIAPYLVIEPGARYMSNDTFGPAKVRGIRDSLLSDPCSYKQHFAPLVAAYTKDGTRYLCTIAPFFKSYLPEIGRISDRLQERPITNSGHELYNVKRICDIPLSGGDPVFVDTAYNPGGWTFLRIPVVCAYMNRHDQIVQNCIAYRYYNPYENRRFISQYLIDSAVTLELAEPPEEDPPSGTYVRNTGPGGEGEWKVWGHTVLYFSDPTFIRWVPVFVVDTGYIDHRLLLNYNPSYILGNDGNSWSTPNGFRSPRESLDLEYLSGEDVEGVMVFQVKDYGARAIPTDNMIPFHAQDVDESSKFESQFDSELSYRKTVMTRDVADGLSICEEFTEEIVFARKTISSIAMEPIYIGKQAAGLSLRQESVPLPEGVQDATGVWMILRERTVPLKAMTVDGFEVLLYYKNRLMDVDTGFLNPPRYPIQVKRLYNFNIEEEGLYCLYGYIAATCEITFHLYINGKTYDLAPTAQIVDCSFRLTPTIGDASPAAHVRHIHPGTWTNVGYDVFGDPILPEDPDASPRQNSVMERIFMDVGPEHMVLCYDECEALLRHTIGFMGVHGREGDITESVIREAINSNEAKNRKQFMDRAILTPILDEAVSPYDWPLPTGRLLDRKMLLFNRSGDLVRDIPLPKGPSGEHFKKMHGMAILER